MSLPDRLKISFVVRFAAPILLTISLSAPSLAQSGQPHAPAARHHLPRAALIVCDTPDVHSCHKEFVRRHRAQGH